eukprot:CAMPEP_0172496644 /NCGR_PEP_ID=MMETSP1066-20121228/90644_1 /TAXON_ID=671091 /ORGANISM="Coscinodiscus wailesii, Strain CCMP2513" /LENGTH=253 /DNA_ID=CAMNT_0013269039 /DNA_START=99 /DNA_END=857 /DNA_ORIENTATION=+
MSSSQSSNSGKTSIPNCLSSSTHPQHPKILLGVTGSVAAVKAPALALNLCHTLSADVRILLTRGGKHFWDRAISYDAHSWHEMSQRVVPSFNDDHCFNRDTAADGTSSSKETRSGRIVINDSEDEWHSWNEIGDDVLHISVRNWADVVVLAPLSAHTLAKVANGFCDDVLSSCLRAWDYGKAVVLAPAMNTAMWNHPLTRRQLDSVCGFGCNGDGSEKGSSVRIVEPVCKVLACGEVGVGGLANVEDIVDVVK